MNGINAVIIDIHKDDEFYSDRSKWVGRTGVVYLDYDWKNGWKKFFFLPDTGSGMVGFHAAKFNPLLDDGEDSINAEIVDIASSPANAITQLFSDWSRSGRNY
jgi:hypothetical protein